MKTHLRRAWFKVHHLKNRLRDEHSKYWKPVKYLILGGIALGFVVGVTAFFIILITLPNVSDAEKLTAAESSLILDRNGKVLYAIHGDENRENVPLDQISKYAPAAIIAIEDDEFYEHSGVDFKAFLLAVCGEFFICGTDRGGSTITQQFIKLTFLGSERSYTRKAREILLALQLEGKFSKDEIIQMYLNRIPYGANIFGIEVASETFFGKPAAELTLAESAVLAAIPNRPTYYSPFGEHIHTRIEGDEALVIEDDLRSEEDVINHNSLIVSRGLLGKTYHFGEGESARDIYLKGRVNLVLDRMEALGYITPEEHKAAQQEADNMVFASYREDIIAPHFVLYVRGLLEEKYPKEVIEQGGLRITTTLDLDMQRAAEKAVADRAETNQNTYGVSNASLVSIDPDTGEILAMVGSRDYWNDEIEGKNNIALRPKSPGSSFKPIVYAAAFIQGLAPSTVLYDVRTRFGSTYEPLNYDRQFRGPVTIRQALGASLNIPAVKAAHLAGVNNILDLARKMGVALVGETEDVGLSIALGTGAATPLEMAQAYSVFANGGYKVNPVAILKVENSNNSIFEEYVAPEKKELVLDPQIAYLVHHILSDPSVRPTDYWRNQLSIPGHISGAKTGTSNSPEDEKGVIYPKDNWTIGYVRHLTTAVWGGNADGTHLNSNADGLNVAAPIWKSYMIEAVKKVEKAEFKQPEGIKWVKVSKRSGKLPSEYTPEDEIVSGIFASSSIPTEYDTSYQMVEIDKVSGKLATEFTPKEAIEKKAFYTHHSILPDNPQWESAVRRWAEENGQDEKPPTEYDDVHTAQNTDEKPEITIVSPKSKSTISPPSLGVQVNISSPAGVEKVEYYFDDELLDTVNKTPFSGNIRLPANLSQGSSHTIKAIVYDELYRSNQSSVSVKIGADDTSPVVDIVYPKNEAELGVGSSVTVNLDTYDPNGAVKRVKFYLDGHLEKEDTISPFDWQFTVPEDEGDHQIKAEAFDYAGNSESDVVNITIVASQDNLEGSSRLLEPSDNSSFDEGAKIPIQAYIAEGDRAMVNEIIFYAKKSGQSAQEIGSISENVADLSTYGFVWDSPSAGTYELYFKLNTAESFKFTNRIKVVVR